MDKNIYLTERVKNHSVLRIGCTDYPITKEKLENNSLLHPKLMGVAASVLGIDNSTEGINILKENGFSNVMLLDAESIELKEKYDFILAGDVLEHMNNPGKFLEKVNDLLEPEGKLIISVPNAFSFNIFKYMIAGREQTHKDHTYFFSVKTLTELCSRFDLLPTKLIFTAQPADQYEKYLFVKMRDFLIKMQKRLAPAFIIEFQDKRYVDTSNYFLWR